MFVGELSSQRRWGKLTVGKVKSLGRLLEVTVLVVQVPFAFRPDDNDVLASRAAFGKETTLKSLLDSAGPNEEGRVIIVPTNRLRKTMQSAVPRLSSARSRSPYRLATQIDGTTGETTTEARRTNTRTATTTAAVTETIPVETVLDIDDNDDNDDERIHNVPQHFLCDDENDDDSCFDDLPRSREKSDIFHIF
jgi:hypothetical protein